MILFGAPWKKYQKELDGIYSRKYMLDAKYEELLKKTQCRACPKHVRGKLPTYAEHYPCCDGCEKYAQILKMIRPLDQIPVDADALRTGPYAEAVWKTYAAKAPALIRIEDGAQRSFTEVFGADLAACSVEQKRDLAGLTEGTGRYRLK